MASGSAAKTKLPNLGLTGIYTVPLAARLVSAHQNKVRSWVNSYPSSEAEPIIQRELPDIGGKTVLSFIELIEAAFVRHFLAMGYTPQTVRKVSQKLRLKHNVDHPFAMNMRFRADGKAIFEETVEDDEVKLVNLMNDNFEFPSVVEKSLFSQILYVQDVAQRWKPIRETPNVVVDPKLSLGKPIILPFAVPTRTLFQAFEAYQSIQDVAEDYEVSEEAVDEAVMFQRIILERTLH